jgi:hypothetical protein
MGRIAPDTGRDATRPEDYRAGWSRWIDGN